MKNKNIVTLLFIIVFGFTLRAIVIDKNSYWFDEAYSHSAAIRPVAFLFQNPPPDVHPPLSFILLRAWYFLVGFDDPYKSRWLSLLFGMAFIVAIFFVSRKWFGDRTALITAFLVCSSLTLIAYSVEARMYAMIIPIALLSFYFLKEQKWLWFVLSTGSLIYFHYYTVFILIPVCIFWFFLRLPWKKMFWNMFFVGVLWTPAVIYFFLQSYGIKNMWLHKPYLMSWISAPAFQYFMPGNQAFSNLQLPNTLYAIIPFVLFFILLGYLFLVDYRSSLNKAMLWSWSVTIAVLLCLAYFPPNIPYHHRFLLVVSPLLFLLLGQGINNFWSKSKTVFFALLIVWFGIQMYMYADYYAHVDTELKSASKLFDKLCPAVVLHESPFSMLPLRSTNPSCHHVLQTSLSKNSMRTGGGSVIEPKDFNNWSIVPDYYVYGDQLINCSNIVGKQERIVLAQCVTVPKPKSQLYANGTMVFNESGLIVVRVDKLNYRPRYRTNMTIRKFATTGSLLHKFLFRQ